MAKQRTLHTAALCLAIGLPAVAGTCTNECIDTLLGTSRDLWVSDSFCDDGGDGSEYAVCAYGTDHSFINSAVALLLTATPPLLPDAA